MAATDEEEPYSAAHYGVYAFKPKSPLAIVDSGIDPYTCVAVWLEAHKQNEFKYRPAQDRTAVERVGEMTAATTLQVLVPLFIVLMTFSSLAGEREQGTLRQLLSLGVRPRHLALGKAVGIAVALALVLLPAGVLGVAALALSSQVGSSSIVRREAPCSSSSICCISPSSSQSPSGCPRARRRRGPRS